MLDYLNANRSDCFITAAVTDDNFQDQADEYIRLVSLLINNTENPLDSEVDTVLRMGASIVQYSNCRMKDLEYYKSKFTPVVPEDLEVSSLKKCHIGKCQCGQLLIEDRHICCPRCKQMIAWPKCS